MFLAEEATNSVDYIAMLESFIERAINIGIKLVIAIIILIFSFKIINFISKRLYKRLHRKQVDETIARVVFNTMRIVLKLLVVVCLVGYVGIETASISALVASMGVGISLAVQGTLANFAGGVIIVLMRPFKIGDSITSNGESGTVEDIRLFYTNIVTPDNRLVMIPNGELANNVIINKSAKENRRCDVVMSISYASDVDKAKAVIREVCESNELILQTPIPYVEIGALSASSVDLNVRVWCKNSDYWPIYTYLITEIKKALEANGIEIPFNQLEVKVKQ